MVYQGVPGAPCHSSSPITSKVWQTLLNTGTSLLLNRQPLISVLRSWAPERLFSTADLSLNPSLTLLSELPFNLHHKTNLSLTLITCKLWFTTMHLFLNRFANMLMFSLPIITTICETNTEKAPRTSNGFGYLMTKNLSINWRIRVWKRRIALVFFMRN